MCLLIVIRGIDREFPVLVAGNRDELRARRASPPGLFVGERHLMLSPRDSVGGGTWMAVNERGMFAGLTNISAEPVRSDATTRGRLPHLALDADGVEGGMAAVRREVEQGAYNAFQLVLADAAATRVLVHDREGLHDQVVDGSVAVVTNEHRLRELVIDGLEPALARDIPLQERIGLLQQVLADPEERAGHRILKLGGEYGTVSSSVVAVHAEDPRQLVWHYAHEPSETPRYRNYGNLGRRLLGL